MAHEQSPAGPQKSNKGVVLLLVGGALILVAAGAVYFLRGSEKPAPEPAPPEVEEVVAPAAPLVAVRESKPIAARDPDGGSAVETEENTPLPADGAKRGGAAEKLGTIDAKAVNTFINSNFGQVKACYERRLRNNPLLEGKVDLNIGVSTRGKVTSVVVNRDTVRDAEMLRCVKKVIRGWRFPKPEGGRVIIGKTFNFKKKG
jgi:hypothetical protein